MFQKMQPKSAKSQQYSLSKKNRVKLLPEICTQTLFAHLYVFSSQFQSSAGFRKGLERSSEIFNGPKIKGIKFREVVKGENQCLCREP